VGVMARRLLIALGMLLGWGPGAYGLDPTLDVSQYAHTSWKVRDGFTQGAINAVAQTPDGYLWLGTEFGLYHFDGVRAARWQPPAGEQLPDNYIGKLLVAHDGTLWIGTSRGLAGWKEGKLTNYPEVAGQAVFSLMQDRNGTVWFGAYNPGRLCAIQGGRVDCYGAGRFGRYVLALYEDHKGSLWLSTETGVWRWKPGPPEQYPFPRGLVEVNSLIEDDSGALLLAANDGLKHLVGGKIQNYTIPGVTRQFRPARFFRSSDGSLWIGSPQGLLHLHRGRTDTFGAADGLSGDFVENILEDREGNIWVSTRTGLDQFREYVVRTISLEQGLSNSLAWSVQATEDGSIWIGTPDGLNRWASEHMTVWGKRSRPGQSGRSGEQELSVSGAATEIANGGLASTARSLGLDDQGRLWVSNSDGVFYFEGGRFIRVSNVAGGNISGIAMDGHGNAWISDDNLGLLCLRPGGAVQQIPWSRFGQKHFGAKELPDRLRGGVWLGFFVDGGIAYFKDGRVLASYSSADGLGPGRVNQLRLGSRGALWVATESGLSRIKDGHIETLNSKNGLPCDEVHWSAEDDDHLVWLNMSCGVARIARSELDAWVSDPKRRVQATLFDASDGVRTVGEASGYGPVVTKARDGKLWFGTPDGVQIIDPHHLPFNTIPPPVHVEQITADHKTYWQKWYRDASSSPPRLPPLVRDLMIDYTAPSLVVPEKVRFRVKLEGWDRDWKDAGNDRKALYSNLPPRKYRFRVMACNNSGVWNEAGTFLDFSIAPAYYQTTWFQATCVAALVLLLWALYQLRLRQLARQFNLTLDARVGERTRIARDLHDTLLQSFQGLLMRFQAVSNELAEGELKQELDEAIDRATGAITEGRDAVQGLRSSVVERNDLAAALGTLGKELAGPASQPPEFTMQVEGAARDLHPILRDEVYRVAGEALRNAFRHADAGRIEVEIRYDERVFRLRVRDDGKGIDPNLLADDGRAGHFGLRGMRERAKRVGGKLTVWSELGSGTEVELRVPASHAYTRFRPPHRSWLAEKFFAKDHEMKS
jgi:signal transduction histidine kinase/ligand-binding sensor domain-containing protein